MSRREQSDVSNPPPSPRAERAWAPLLLAIALAAHACASLSPAAKAIRFGTKADTSTCRFLKVVYGGPSLTPREEALENAAMVRATHIVALYEEGGKFTADAFDCSESGRAVAAKPAVPGEATPASTAATLPLPVEPGPAQEWIIAVMDVENRMGSEDPATTSLLQNVGEQLRVFIAERGLRTIDRSQQVRALQEQIGRMKSESYGSCYDDGCQLELGKALAASHILRTQVTRFGKSCVLNAELIDLTREVTISATSTKGTCEEEGFLAMSEEVARGVARR